jgi:hypothetical protein
VSVDSFFDAPKRVAFGLNNDVNPSIAFEEQVWTYPEDAQSGHDDVMSSSGTQPARQAGVKG